MKIATLVTCVALAGPVVVAAVWGARLVANAPLLEPRFPFVNPNHLAGFLEIALAVGIGLLIADLEDTGQRTWRRFVRDIAQVLLSRKAPLRIFLIVMVVGLVMTRSRMGNTAFFSSLLVAGAIGLALSRHASNRCWH